MNMFFLVPLFCGIAAANYVNNGQSGLISVNYATGIEDNYATNAINVNSYGQDTLYNGNNNYGNNVSPLINSINPTWLLTVLTNNAQQISALTFDFSQPPQTQWRGYPGCRGRRQSPIDISGSMTVDRTTSLSLSPSTAVPKPIAVAFNDATLAAILPAIARSNEYLIVNGIRYKFARIHLHFNVNDNYGSLHSINGQKYPLESSSVWFREEYGTLTNALNHDGATVNLVQLLQIGNHNPDLDSFINVLPSITVPNATAAFVPDPVYGSLAASIPDLNGKFYWYKGSLELPPCSETITWFVFDNIRQLSQEQMRRIQNSGLRNKNGQLIVKNSRYIQPRNGRPIYVHSGNNYLGVSSAYAAN